MFNEIKQQHPRKQANKTHGRKKRVLIHIQGELTNLVKHRITQKGTSDDNSLCTSHTCRNKKGLITRYSVWAVQEGKMRLKIATLIFFCFKQLEWKSEK